MKTFSKLPGGESVRQIVCPVCGEDRVRAFWDCGEFSYKRCTQCGLIHQNPQPVQQELSNRYDDEYFAYERANEAQFYELMRKALDDIHFEELEERLGPNGSFLDVGCATGMLISELAQRGWESAGVELCEPAARYAIEERGCEVFIGTLEQASYPDERYDVVHSSHVIEHLTDPSGFIREVHRVLKPGGYVITATPNADGLQARLFGAEWRSAIADHVALLSLRTLTRLLSMYGFQVVRHKTWGGLGVGTAPRWLKTVADKLAKPMGFGDVMIVLAQKRVSGVFQTP